VRLDVKGIGFSYNSIPVLDDLSLEVESGEILTVIGPNGSGKSTLLRCIDRILKPQTGSILIDGRETSRLDGTELAKKIGYVPQRENRSFPATVFDTVLIGRRPHIKWRAGPRDLQVVGDVIDTLGLNELAMRDISEISGGQRQKVVVARALAQEPEVLLLDEPTSSLDLRHQLEVLDAVKDQVEQRGISAVIAIHDLNLASRYSHKIIMLNEGRIFAAGGAEILTPENIESVYGVKVSILYNQGRLTVVPEAPVG